MKIGLLSDAHGNPEGLANCLSVLQSEGAERLYFLGDAVGYLPNWSEVLKLLQDHGVTCIRGNHDALALKGALQEDATDAYQLLPGYLETIQPYIEWMASWPESITVDLDGLSLMFIHASPIDALNGYVYPWTDVSAIDWPQVDAIGMGHTHRPFSRLHEGRLLFNPGSCGLPRDIGHLASCAILDTQARDVVIYRVPFDVKHVLADARFIHPDVRQCLARSPDRFEGRVVKRPSESPLADHKP